MVQLKTDLSARLGSYADVLRPKAAHAIARLNELGLTTVMLTGDNELTAQQIGKDVGIAVVKAELLPEDKLQEVRELQSKYGEVGMLGDGINDAPALAHAEVGFAMGAVGSDTAIETADVALMDDDLGKLPAFIELSRSARRILLQNIGAVLGIKAVYCPCSRRDGDVVDGRLWSAPNLYADAALNVHLMGAATNSLQSALLLSGFGRRVLSYRRPLGQVSILFT